MYVTRVNVGNGDDFIQEIISLTDENKCVETINSMVLFESKSTQDRKFIKERKAFSDDFILTMILSTSFQKYSTMIRIGGPLGRSE